MNTRPALLRSIPYWILVAVSIIVIAVGAWILTTKIGAMTTTLTDGSATAVDVYVGPTVALLGAVLIGVGIIGILIALAVAALSTLRPRAAVEVVEAIEWTEEDSVEPVAVVEAPAAAVVAETPVEAEAPIAAEAAPVADEAAPVAAEVPASAPEADTAR